MPRIRHSYSYLLCAAYACYTITVRFACSLGSAKGVVSCCNVDEVVLKSCSKLEERGMVCCANKNNLLWYVLERTLVFFSDWWPRSPFLLRSFFRYGVLWSWAIPEILRLRSPVLITFRSYSHLDAMLNPMSTIRTDCHISSFRIIHEMECGLFERVIGKTIL